MLTRRGAANPLARAYIEFLRSAEARHLQPLRFSAARVSRDRAVHRLAGLPAELWQALWLTVRLAFSAALILLLQGIPLACWLNQSRWRGVSLVETLIALPIVLPPTVTGFYLLILLAPQSPVGRFWLDTFGLPLTFGFAELVVASVLCSLPFAV